MSRLSNALLALLGVSAYSPPEPMAGAPDEEAIDRMREALGGNISPLPTTRLRWYLADLETAQRKADSGDISDAAQLWRAMKRDGKIRGLMGTLTGGLVRLPKIFYGDEELVSELRARNGTRPVFDEMVPSTELALFAGDGEALGVAVGELVPVQGRNYPVFVRLAPEWLRYRWNEGRWYYHSVAGAIPITPGDGRWVLHLRGGRVEPWNAGLWPALGRAFINKEHALLHRSNFSAKLANPARVAYSPAGATQAERAGFLAKLIAWGMNTAFEMPIGWDAKILETNGRGYEVYKDEIATSDEEVAIAIAGQVVTVDGGAGFSNADIHRLIREDIIKEVADALAYTVNTQILPAFTVSRKGFQALATAPVIEYDTRQPKDREAEARTMGTLAPALAALRTELAVYHRQLDIGEITTRFGVPILGDVNGDGTPDAETPTSPAPEPAPEPTEEQSNETL